MKTIDLKPGIRFKVSDVCDPTELSEEYTVISVNHIESEIITGRNMTIFTDVEVMTSSGIDVIKIGNWAELTEIKK